MAGFSAVLLVTLMLSAMNFVLMRQVQTHMAALVSDALPGVTTGAKIKSNIALTQISLLGHIMADTPEEKRPLEAKVKELKDANQVLLDDYAKTIIRAKDRENFDKLVQARKAYGDARTKLLELSDANQVIEAEAYNSSTVRPAFDECQRAGDALFDDNAKYGEDTGTTCQKIAKNAVTLTLIIAIVVVLIGLALASTITRSLATILRRLADSLDDGSKQVASASSEVSSASQSLAEGSSEQAASLEETSSSLEEMSSMVKRTADNAQHAKDLASETRSAADAGAIDMKAMSQAMSDIKSSSDSIAKIIKTIDEIAFQTNILAINAAVEAARAGEAGMGFAVVADEVRALAQRCAAAAKETTSQIEDSISKSAQGVQISAKVEESLEAIVAKARQVDDLVAEIATASKEQSQGISQVNMAVTEMDKVTQSNAANA